MSEKISGTATHRSKKAKLARRTGRHFLMLAGKFGENLIAELAKRCADWLFNLIKSWWLF